MVRYDSGMATTKTTQTQTPKANCLRCGRTLRSAKSIAAGYGPVCSAKVRAAARDAAKARYAHKPHLVAKAEELIEAGGVIPLRGKTCRTAGSEGAGYLTHPAACNCKAGLRSKYLCHHRIAVDVFISTYGTAA